MPTSSAGKNRLDPQAGLTLMEVLVVLGILSMTYLLLSPFSGRIFPGASLNAASERLAGDLRDLRSRAILSGSPTTLYLLEDGQAWGFSENEIAQVMPQEGRIILEGENSEENLASFYPDGKSNGFTLVLQLGERTKTIRSDWITGKIIIE